MKVCSKCGIEKDFSEFYKNKRTKDFHTCHCKQCFKECLKERRKQLKTDKKLQLEKAIRSSVILENKILAKENKKLCGSCKNIFFVYELSSVCRCKNCEKEYDKSDKRKEYYKSDKRKEYYKSDKRKEYYKEYKKSDKYKEYNREYQKQYRLKQKQLKANI